MAPKVSTPAESPRSILHRFSSSSSSSTVSSILSPDSPDSPSSGIGIAELPQPQTFSSEPSNEPAYPEIPYQSARTRPRHMRSLSDATACNRSFTDHIFSARYADVRESYILENPPLGTGMMGVVRKCTEQANREMQWACKTVSKTKLQCRDDVQLLVEEVEVMRKVARHNVMLKLKEVVEDEQDVHLILELCPGGDLFDRVATHPYTERESAHVLRSLISAVHYMHHCGYMHRDIKPENVFLTRKDSNVNVRLGDFGQACRIVKDESHSFLCGSSYYVAPEVIGRCYNKEADIWSLGILLYVLLCGRPPFGGSSHHKILSNITRKEADYEHGPWKNVSKEAIDLVQRMLTKDPSQRITARGVKMHPWILRHFPQPV